LHVWKGSLPGPLGSVYEGGVFDIEIVLPSDYPFTAPKALFKTRIYHMNISEQGNICIDILKQNWSPALSLFKVMLSLSSLLTDPNPKDPLVPSIATLYTRDRRRHDATARQWTQAYAKAPPPPPTAVHADPPKSNKSKGKNKADPQPVNIAGSSSRSTRSSVAAVAAPPSPIPSSVASTSNDVITIDSDEDVDNGRSTGSKSKNTKRKRASNGSSAGIVVPSGGEVLDLLDSDEEKVIKKSRSRRTQSRADRNSGVGGSSVTSDSTQPGDVIVIDDD